jgi:hypothetical protein
MDAPQSGGDETDLFVVLATIPEGREHDERKKSGWSFKGGSLESKAETEMTAGTSAL